VQSRNAEQYFLFVLLFFFFFRHALEAKLLALIKFERHAHEASSAEDCKLGAFITGALYFCEKIRRTFLNRICPELPDFAF